MLRYDASVRLSSTECLLRSDVFSVASPNSEVAGGGGVAGGLGGKEQQVLSDGQEEGKGGEPGEEGGGGGKRSPARILPDELERPEETALVGERGYVRKRVTEIERIDEYFAKKQADEKDYAARSQGSSYDGAEADLPQSFGAGQRQTETQVRTTAASANQPLGTRKNTGGDACTATGGHAKAGEAKGNADPVTLGVNVEAQRIESYGASGRAPVGDRPSREVGGGREERHRGKEEGDSDAVGGTAEGVGEGDGGYESDSFDEDEKSAMTLAAAALAATTQVDGATAPTVTTALDATETSDATAVDGGTSLDDATAATDAETPAAAALVPPDDDVDATSREPLQVVEDDSSEKEEQEGQKGEEEKEEARPASPELVRYLDGAEVDEEGQEGGGEGGEDGWRVAGAFRVLVASGPGGELAGRAMRRMLLSTSRRRHNQQQQQQQPQQQPGPSITQRVLGTVGLAPYLSEGRTNATAGVQHTSAFVRGSCFTRKELDGSPPKTNRLYEEKYVDTSLGNPAR